jgi:hypothetical protein
VSQSVSERRMLKSITPTDSRVPLAVKLAYTVYLAVLIPVYWHYYGPTNFLYFCDLALIITLLGIWPENALLISKCCVGILVPQFIWLADFGGNLAGIKLTGMTDYMFDSSHSLFLRLLSLFHGWLPLLLIYLVFKTGYDRRALHSWTVLAWIVLPICFFLMPGPTAHPGLIPVNINYVFGTSDFSPQTLVPAYLWFAGMLIGLPLLVFLPTHAVLARVVPSAHAPSAPGAQPATGTA